MQDQIFHQSRLGLTSIVRPKYSKYFLNSSSKVELTDVQYKLTLVQLRRYFAIGAHHRNGHKKWLWLRILKFKCAVRIGNRCVNRLIFYSFYKNFELRKIIFQIQNFIGRIKIYAAGDLSACLITMVKSLHINCTKNSF